MKPLLLLVTEARNIALIVTVASFIAGMLVSKYGR